MKVSAKNAAWPWGFTLIELLTVIAIISILATLLASSLGTAKKKARASQSISNLRQIALGLQLYTDDHAARPKTFLAQVAGRYLSERALQCAEDQSFGRNWAGAIERFSERAAPGADPAFGIGTQTAEVNHSYFGSFDWADSLWEQISRNPLGGVAACQLHGVGRPNWSAPERTAFEGNVLRAVKDGSVVSRQVFWGMESAVDVPGSVSSEASFESEFPFFLDPAR